ncbi:hypothetical protein D3C84_1079990 [compost metagenome]
MNCFSCTRASAWIWSRNSAACSKCIASDAANMRAVSRSISSLCLPCRKVTALCTSVR